MPTKPVIDAITAALVAGGDPESESERVKGFQRALAKKDTEIELLRQAAGEAAALKKRLEELEISAMPESQRETFYSQREREENARLRTQLELANLALKYPDVAPHFNAIYNARTAEEQALYLKGLLSGASRGSTPVVSEDDFSGDVDLNNPMRGPDDDIGGSPTLVRDEATADRILKAFGDLPTAEAYR